MTDAAKTKSNAAPYLRAAAEFHRGAYGDSADSRKFLEQAASAGDARARLLLGRHYLTSNPSMASSYFRNAAENRCATAATELARFYMGNGTEYDFAQKLLRMSANKGDVDAQMLLGQLLATAGREDGHKIEAAFWLELSLRNAIALNDKQREANVRQTLRSLGNSLDEKTVRRAQTFLDQTPSTVVSAPPSRR